MSLPMISSVRGLIKNMAMELKWQERKKNPYMEKSGIMSEVERINKQAEEHRKQMTIMGIEGKLKSGQKLSAAEMDYLKTNAPELYEKAVTVQKEREEYRRELERCKTKDDVRELNMQRVARLDAEVKAVQQSGMPAGAKREAIALIGMRAAAIMNEHAEYVNTTDYKKLPTREELEKEKENKKAEKKSDVEDEDFWKTKPPAEMEIDSEMPELPGDIEQPETDIPADAKNPADTADNLENSDLPDDGSAIFTELMDKIDTILSGTPDVPRNSQTTDTGIYTPKGKKKQ